MSTESKITYLLETKNLIKEAIIATGVEVSNNDTFRSYAQKITQIKANAQTPISGTTLRYDTTKTIENTEFVSETKAIQTIMKNENYIRPPIIMATNVEGMLSCLITAGQVDKTTPGTYELEYTAYDGDNNASEPIQLIVKVLNYTPTIYTYSKTGAIEVLQEKEYSYEIKVEFEGEGTIYKNGSTVGEDFQSGKTLSDGNYRLVVKNIEDELTTTKEFSVNTKGPAVTVEVQLKDGTTVTKPIEVHGYYEGKTKIIFDKTNIKKAKLTNITTGQVWTDVNEIAGKILEENDYNEYSLRLEDTEGRVTDIYDFAVDIY